MRADRRCSSGAAPSCMPGDTLSLFAWISNIDVSTTASVVGKKQEALPVMTCSCANGVLQDRWRMQTAEDLSDNSSAEQ